MTLGKFTSCVRCVESASNSRLSDTDQPSCHTCCSWPSWQICPTTSTETVTSHDISQRIICMCASRHGSPLLTAAAQHNSSGPSTAAHALYRPWRQPSELAGGCLRDSIPGQASGSGRQGVHVCGARPTACICWSSAEGGTGGVDPCCVLGPQERG